MTARHSLSPTRRVAIFKDAGGVCHLCGQKIQVGQPWEVEHVIPLALLGADDETNMRPAHEKCHEVKTRADVGSIAKAKRCEARHLGIKKPSSFRKPPGVKWDWKLGRNVRA